MKVKRCWVKGSTEKSAEAVAGSVDWFYEFILFDVVSAIH